MFEAASRDQVLEAIEAERAEWDALLAEVGEGRMEKPGVAGSWTFKDVAAHLTAWRQRSLDRLEAAARGEPDPPPPWPVGLDEDDPINEWFYQRDRDRPLDDVLLESRESFARLGGVVRLLADEDLSDPNRFPWMEGEALGPSIVGGSFFGHLHQEHGPSIRAWLAETTVSS